MGTVLLAFWCLFAFSQLPGNNGYGTGAPRSVCRQTYRVPDHAPNRPQSSTSPFSISIELDEDEEEAVPGVLAYRPGQVFKVTLRKDDQTERDFKGFIIIGEEASGTGMVGSFSINSRSRYFRETCNDHAITQRYATYISSVSAKWKAPSTEQGDIIFRASAVRSFGTYWTGIESPVLKDASRVVVPPRINPLANVTDSCQESELEPLILERPHVAVLCSTDEHCPCGWRCCPECDDAETQMSWMCHGYAICRKPRSQQNDDIE